MMITYKEKPDDPEVLERILNPTVKEWFFSRFEEFSLPQLYGTFEIHCRNNLLVSAPTGATKTLTAFLSILNELVDSAQKGILEDKVYAVYISPLKALNYDIQVNLLEPLEEIEKLYGKELGIRVAVRTGDTTQSEKVRMLKKPPHILITTPESLAIMMSSPKFKENLRTTQWCIVDEIHALAENKRGVHLSLSLERLERLAKGMCRVGLSATVSPLDEVAKFLVGNDRDCKVVDVQFIKDMDLKVLSPVPDLVNTTYERLSRKTYELIDDLINQHKTTLIFTNTRAGTERVVHHLKESFPGNYTKIDEDGYDGTTSLIGTHHGSLSKELRFQVEQNLREGKLKAVVSSTSLELGIDIGFIDLVICIGSPKSVARFLQRGGRAGHRLHDTVKARIIVTDRDDLVECSVLLKNAIEKKIDRLHIPTNCLDVLAQQVFGIVLEEEIKLEELFKMVKRSYCFKDLQRDEFIGVIEYLSGEYTSLKARHVYAKIWYNEETGTLRRRGKMGRVIYMTNIGTIPDAHGVAVKVGSRVIGSIDETFLERLKKGDIFVLGGETYQFKFARGMVAQVDRAAGKLPTVPSWFSEMLPLSFDLALSIQHFRYLMNDKLESGTYKDDVIKFIDDYLYVDAFGAEAIYNYFKEQYDFLTIPNEKKILIEHYNDGLKRYDIFHTLYGRRVNDVLSRAVGYAIAKIQGRDVEIGVTDNGFYIASEKGVDVNRAFSRLRADELPAVMGNAIERSEVLKRRFRHCAGRALMILRQYKGHKKRVGRQQVSSMLLLNAVKKISNNFPILKEARREVLEDLMDIENAARVVGWIEEGKIKVVDARTSIPSPFALNMVMQGYSDLMKADDRVEFLRKMHRMVLAKIALDEGKKRAGEYSAV